MKREKVAEAIFFLCGILKEDLFTMSKNGFLRRQSEKDVILFMISDTDNAVADSF